MALQRPESVRYIKIPLLRFGILLFTDREQVEQFEQLNGGIDDKLNVWDESLGFVSHILDSGDGSHCYMMFIRQPDHLVIVHECSHMVTMIMNYCGIECDEMRARLMEHLFKKVCKAVGLECLG
jgi:hypothetical protein